MIESQINGLFPTPVYITKLTREFSENENQLIDDYKLKTYKNAGNVTSMNDYILEIEQFSNLKKELTDIVKDYYDKIISSSDNIEPYITQSWLNYTKLNEYHHTHAHPNSLVSGVLYINADKDNDKIFFHKNNKHQTIKPTVKNFNPFNSDTWWFPVKTLDIILFPSSLTHDVEIKQGDNTRISLAFNTFIKGKLGDNQALTELKI